MRNLWRKLSVQFHSNFHLHSTRRLSLECLGARMLLDAGAWASEIAEGEDPTAPDFWLPNVNPNSFGFEEWFTPSDWSEQTTAWYFGQATLESSQTQFGLLDALQNEIEAAAPEKHIHIIGVNAIGHGQDVSEMVNGRDLILLQDETGEDVWTNWNANLQDLVVVNAELQRVGVINLATFDLSVVGNSAAVKQILLDLAFERPFWQNQTNPLDVNDDDLITPVDDVLRLINELNLHAISDAATGRLPLPIPPNRPAPYFDVNGDGFVSATGDALPVINSFNRDATGEGESAAQSDAQADNDTNVIQLSISISITQSNVASSHIVAIEFETAERPVPASVSQKVEVATPPEQVLARVWHEHPADLLGEAENELSEPFVSPLEVVARWQLAAELQGSVKKTS